MATVTTFRYRNEARLARLVRHGVAYYDLASLKTLDALPANPAAGHRGVTEPRDPRGLVLRPPACRGETGHAGPLAAQQAQQAQQAPR